MIPSLRWYLLPIVSDKTVMGGKRRDGECWRALRWLDGSVH
jgi:hypothetical protein